MIAALVCGLPDGALFPGRSTFPLLGRPMMVYPLLAAKHAQQVHAVFLSTDAPSMARVAGHEGVRVLARPAQLQGPRVPLEAVVADGYRQIAAHDHVEALVVLLCNAPTVTSDMIEKGIDVLLSDRSWDAVASVSLHNEFSPQYALRLGDGDRLEHLVSRPPQVPDIFFADALMWVLRPDAYFGSLTPSGRWLLSFAERKVAPLIHEGYGDVDYAWQVPAIEGWLRRRGFSETATPYALADRTGTANVVPPTPQRTASPAPASRRVLITTIPFGEPDRRPLDLLDAEGIDYVINPIGRRLREQELAQLAADFGVLVAGTEPITADVMRRAPHLRLIARVGVGLDNVDLLAARSLGIQVTYTPDAPAPAVAELAIAQLLNLLRHVSVADRGMRNGVWHRSMGRRLDGLTVGVVGVGRVGKRVIRALRGGFPAVSILANDLSPELRFGDAYGVRWTDKETLYRESDAITLHVPLTPHTQRLITVREIDLMKPTAVLINTARGNMIDEHDLANALRAGRIAGAAIDVFGQEPYTGELATLERCLLTCHMGSMSQDCRARMEVEAVEEAVGFLRNEPPRQPVPDAEYLLRGAAASI